MEKRSRVLEARGTKGNKDGDRRFLLPRAVPLGLRGLSEKPVTHSGFDLNPHKTLGPRGQGHPFRKPFL